MHLNILLARTGIHTVIKVANLHGSWADAEKEDAFLLVLYAELSDDNVQGRLGGSVDRSRFDVDIVDPVKVTVTAGNGDALLHLALLNQRDEEIEEVDIADDIGLE